MRERERERESEQVAEKFKWFKKLRRCFYWLLRKKSTVRSEEIDFWYLKIEITDFETYEYDFFSYIIKICAEYKLKYS